MSTKVGDLADFAMVAGIAGGIKTVRVIVTHVTPGTDGDPDSYSGVGVSDGQISHVSNTSQPHVVIAPAHDEVSRAFLAGLLVNPNLQSPRVITRLREIAELVTLHRAQGLVEEARQILHSAGNGGYAGRPAEVKRIARELISALDA